MNKQPSTTSDEPAGALISPFLEALEGRKLKIRLRHNHAPLITAYGLLHRRMERAITSALKALEEYETVRLQEGVAGPMSGNLAGAADAFADTVYRVAELFEFYDTDIVDYLDPSMNRELKAKYKSALKRISDHWNRICNGCKHNHSILVPAEGLYTNGVWVTGFTMYRHEKAEMWVDTGVHKFSDAFSYNWAFRRLLCAIMEADQTAANLLEALEDNLSCESIRGNLLPLPYTESIRKVSERSKAAFPMESKAPVTHLSIVASDGSEIVVSEASPVQEAFDCAFRCVLEIASPETAFQHPYSRDVMKLSLSREKKAPNLPISGFYRIAVSGLSIPPT